jgi:hypothetical protein
MEGVTCRCSKNGGGDGGCGVGFMVRNQKGRSTGRCRCRLQRFVKYLVWVEDSGLVKKSFCTDWLHSVKSDIFLVRNQKGRSTGRCRCRLQRFVKYLVWVEGWGLVKKSFCTTDRLHSVKSDIFLTSIDEKIS